MKLFILGNGFDIAHNLPTKFKHFKEYLKKESKGQKNFFPSTYMGKDGGTLVERTSLIAFIIELVNSATESDWCDFEEAMGQFDYEMYIEDFDIDDEYDDNPFHAIYNREDMASELRFCVPLLRDLFHEWILTIDTDVAPTNFANLISNKDLVLTFNYTDTLEKTYEIEQCNVCHIHGSQDSEIVVGHGKEENPYEEESMRYLGAQETFFDLFEDFKKDTQACFSRHIDFFNTVAKSQITDIYSYGFSFSTPDLLYITKLCELCDTSKMIWHLSDFDSEQKKCEYRQIITGCGFKGTFGEHMPIIKY